MDANNGIPNQGDWRGQLHPGSRQRIVNKITENLNKHIPVSGQEGLLELQNIAQMFEEKIFTTAKSQSDYLKKISLKMLTFEIKSRGTTVTNITSSLDKLTLETEPQDTMANNITSSLELETESQCTMANNMTSNQVGPINEPLDPANGRLDQGDWRGKLQPGMRGRHVNILLNTLKRRLPFSGQEGLRQLRKLAQRFEERIFTAATSQYDYARNIFLRCLKIGNKSQGGSLVNNMTWNQIPANGRPNQGDWRGTLKPEERGKVINRIRYTLKRLPIVSGQGGSDEFGKIAESFEEGIFTSATNKADYARKIRSKNHALRSKYQGLRRTL